MIPVKLNIAATAVKTGKRKITKLDGYLYVIPPAYVFLHRSVSKNSVWTCSEFYTGMSLARGETAQEALDNCTEILSDKTEDDMINSINNYLNDNDRANEEDPGELIKG